MGLEQGAGVLVGLIIEKELDAADVVVLLEDEAVALLRLLRRAFRPLGLFFKRFDALLVEIS